MMDNALRWQKVFKPQYNHKDFVWRQLRKQNILPTLGQGKYMKVVNPRPHTVADLVAKTLSNWSVQQTFGVAVASGKGLPETLSKPQSTNNIAYYEVINAQTAAFAASAYGSLTGRPAACFAENDIESKQLLKSLEANSANRIPVIALTAQNDFQTQTHRMPQWSKNIQADSNHAELASRACKNALLHNSISHLNFPADIQARFLDTPMQAGAPQGRLPSQNISPPQDALQDAITLLRASERPVILVGHGARDRMEPVIQLAEQLRAPILTSVKGKGLIPNSHPLFGGVFGNSGIPVARNIMNDADAILIFGANFGEHTEIATQCPTVQVDYDLSALAKYYPIDMPVWGEIGVTAQALSDDFLGDMWTKDQTKAVAEHWENWQASKQQAPMDLNTISPAMLFETLSETVNEDAIIAIDAGKSADAFGGYFVCKQQSVLMSGYAEANDGFALPAAIGAWTATQEHGPKFKDRQVVSITDMASFNHSDEFETAIKYNMNITHVVMVDEITDTACITHANELGTALNDALRDSGPRLIEVLVS